jgi:hypothetical protein
MVLESKIMIEFGPCLSHSPSFQLNIARVGSHLLKGSWNPYIKKSVKALIKLLNLSLP